MHCREVPLIGRDIGSNNTTLGDNILVEELDDDECSEFFDRRMNLSRSKNSLYINQKTPLTTAAVRAFSTFQLKQFGQQPLELFDLTR